MTLTENSKVRIEAHDEEGNRVSIYVSLGLGCVTIDAFRNGEARTTLDIELGEVG